MIKWEMIREIQKSCFITIQNSLQQKNVWYQLILRIHSCIDRHIVAVNGRIPVWVWHHCIHIIDLQYCTVTIINSLAPWMIKWNFRLAILKLILLIGGCGISCEFTFRGITQDLTDKKSTLVQVMAWCRQAPSHYLNQCWPRSLYHIASLGRLLYTLAHTSGRLDAEP